MKLTNKSCNACKKSLPLSDFGQRKDQKGYEKFEANCKPCSKKIRLTYHISRTCVQCNKFLDVSKFWKSQSRCISCLEYNREQAHDNLEDCYVKAAVKRRTGILFEEQHPELIEEARNILKLHMKYENHKTHSLCTVCFKPRKFNEFGVDITKSTKRHPHCLYCTRKTKRLYSKKFEGIDNCGIEELSDGYVRGLLTSHGSALSREDIPQELVDLKREEVKLGRLIREKYGLAKRSHNKIVGRKPRTHKRRYEK